MVWTLVVVGCLGASIGTGVEESTVAGWLAKNAGALVLAAAALPLPLLRFDRDQWLAGLVAISLLGAWTVFFPARALLSSSSQFDPERPGAGVLLACTVVTVAVCFVAQWTARRSPQPASTVPSG